MRTVNRGCNSEHMFEKAMAAFKEVNSRMDDVEPEVESSDKQRSGEADANEAMDGSNQFAEAENADQYANIRPPPVAKTKGSKKSHHQKARGTAPTKTTKPVRPQPELDEHGKPKKVKRLCGICNTRSGHNARTCEKRQLAQKLREAHSNVYGDAGSKKKVNERIKKIIAKQYEGDSDEEYLLDTDEEEDYEDTDEEDVDEVEEVEKSEGVDEEEDGEAGKENEEHADGEEEGADAEEPVEEIVEANADGAQPGIIQNGQRTCSTCHLRTKHNARTCKDRQKILQQQLADTQQNGETKQIVPLGVRTCGTCGEIAGHNARTCERRRLQKQKEEEMAKLKEKEHEHRLKQQKPSIDSTRGSAKTQKPTVTEEDRINPRRSNRLR